MPYKLVLMLYALIPHLNNAHSKLVGTIHNHFLMGAVTFQDYFARVVTLDNTMFILVTTFLIVLLVITMA